MNKRKVGGIIQWILLGIATLIAIISIVCGAAIFVTFMSGLHNTLLDLPFFIAGAVGGMIAIPGIALGIFCICTIVRKIRKSRAEA